ncbi:MAG: diguanylate cyclase [Candidatus Longimicrobiales bacterium M2_2A_002]
MRRAAPRTIWWPLGCVLLVAALMPVAVRDTRDAVIALPWMAAPLIAAVAWARSAQHSRGRARTVLWTLSMAATLGLVVVLVRVYGASASEPGVAWTPHLLLLPHLVIAGGAGLALSSRPVRAWQPGLVADAVLLFLAIKAITLRVVMEPVILAGASTGDAVLAALQSLAGLPALLAALVVLQRSSVLAPRAAVLLLIAALVFGVADLLALDGVAAAPLTPGSAFGLAWIAGWLLYAWSGSRAREDAVTGRMMEARRRVRDLLRKLLIPSAALFMALAVVDIGLGRPPQPATVAVIALFGAILALRTGRVFAIADRDADQRRQLAHTRALLDATHALAGTMDVDRTLGTISESARSVFGTRAAGIELVTDEGSSLETRSAIGLPDHVVGLRFPVEGSFTGWVVRHGRPRATVDPSRDPYIQPQSLDFLGQLPVAAAPIRFQGETLGALYTCIREEPFDAEELELLNALAEQAGIAIQNARLFQQVTELSITDPLTGLANRRQLERELAREFAAARRGRDLTAVIFDLDDFKHYNDTNGHLAGDRAIQAFARALDVETRAMNLAARYGGDEFVALLAGTDRPGAEAFIERVRVRFDRAMADMGSGAIGVSAGMAVFRQDMADTDTLLREADNALYREKPRARA